MVGYSRLMEADEAGTLAALKDLRKDVIDPAIAGHDGRLVKTTGDGMLVEFGSVADAVRCAVAFQKSVATSNVAAAQRIAFRVGVNLGEIIIEDDDIYGNGVNVAARLESIAEPGGICVSGTVYEQVAGILDLEFEDMGEQTLKNTKRPIRGYAVRMDGAGAANADDAATLAAPVAAPVADVPDKPSITVLPFDNMSSDQEQEFFCDGMAEDIITALSKISGLLVIARNSTFTYKGKAVDVTQVGRDLGVRYVLEGSVRKAGEKVRITAQLSSTPVTGHTSGRRGSTGI